MKVATTCMQVTFSKKENLKKYCQFIDEAAEQGSKLIVFPEQSLQGYLYDLFHMTTEIYDFQTENAELVPQGETTQMLIEKAKEKDIYIIWGMTERDQNDYGILYNTAVLVGPEGYIGKYEKVHQPGNEKHAYLGGDGFKVFDTAIGKIGMLICYDKAFPESVREMLSQGAEIIVHPTAWPAVDGNRNEDDMFLTLYNMYEKVRAIENNVFFISSNHTGKLGNIDYCAHSRITRPDGVSAACTEWEEGIVYADIDVKKEIAYARNHAFGGLNVVKDRRPEVYTHICSLSANDK